MRLIDLPITLREAAVKNQIAQGNKRDVFVYLHEPVYRGNFSWIGAKQPYKMWIYADCGLFSQTLKYKL